MLKAAIGEIMSENIVKIKENASVRDAAHILLRFQINGLLVLSEDGQRVVGIVTTTDFLRLMDQALSKPGQRMKELKKMSELRVADVASRDMISVQKNTKIEKVVSIMRRKNVHTLPVYNGDKLVGVIGKHDLINAAFYPK